MHFFHPMVFSGCVLLLPFFTCCLPEDIFTDLYGSSTRPLACSEWFLLCPGGRFIVPEYSFPAVQYNVTFKLFRKRIWKFRFNPKSVFIRTRFPFPCRPGLTRPGPRALRFLSFMYKAVMCWCPLYLSRGDIKFRSAHCW